MITTAAVSTAHGVAYTRRLCKHFSHRIPASAEGNRGRIQFPFGVCSIECDEKIMHIRVELADPESADRAERVIADHLVRMANKDEPVVTWQRESL
jgi:hypothetical protein